MLRLRGIVRRRLWKRGGWRLTKSTDVISDDVIQATELTSPCGICHLDEVDWRSSDGDGHPEPDEEATSHERADRFSRSLDDCSHHDERRAHEHAEATANGITGGSSEETAEDVADAVDGEDEADA